MTGCQTLLIELAKQVPALGALIVAIFALRNAVQSKTIASKAQESEFVIWVEAATATEVHIWEPPALYRAFPSIDEHHRAVLVTVKIIVANRSVQRANTIVLTQMDLEDRPSSAHVIPVPPRALMYPKNIPDIDQREMYYRMIADDDNSAQRETPEWRPDTFRFDNLRGVSIKPGDAVRDIYHDVLLPIGAVPNKANSLISMSIQDIYGQVKVAKTSFIWTAIILDKSLPVIS